MTERPPRLFALFVKALPLRHRDHIAGDLLEEYSTTVLARLGRRRARLWLWSQLVRSIVADRARRQTRRTVDVDTDTTAANGHAYRPVGRKPRRGDIVHNLLRDLRYAARLLRRSPGFSIVATLTLAVGIGASTTIFSVVDGVLLKPLPFPDQERLVSVTHTSSGGEGVPPEVYLTSGSYLVYRDESRTLDGLAWYSYGGENLSVGDRPLRVQGAAVSPNFFSVLGVEPRGSGFAQAAQESDNPRVVVISHSLWQRLPGLGGDILGKTIRLDGLQREVVGVMPADFRFPGGQTDLWYPIVLDAASARNVNFALQSVGRLALGVTSEDASADLDALFERPFELFRNEGISAVQLRDLGFKVSVRPLVDTLVGDVGPILWMLFAAVGLILLVACANVAILFLAQSEERERELAVQAALGSSRWRQIRQFLAQAGLLTVAGGGLGLLLSVAGTRLVRLLGPTLPRAGDIGIDARVLGFTLAVSAGVALFFGSFPALCFRATRAAAALKEGVGAGPGRHRHFTRRLLAASQIAVALVLLVASGLLLQTLANLRSVHLGFDPDRLVVFDLTLNDGTAVGRFDETMYHQRILERIEGVSGVTAASAASRFFGLPIASQDSRNPVWVEGEQPPEGSLPPVRSIRIVMPGYLKTLGIPVLAGRSIELRDITEATGAAIVSKSFAREHWGKDDPIGKRITPWPGPGVDWLTVVGVAGDVRLAGPAATPAPTVYFGALIRRNGEPASYSGTNAMSYALRVAMDPEAIVPAIREAVVEVAPDLPLENVRTMRAVVSESIARTSYTLGLLAAGAGVAFLLAVVGVYAVMVHSARRRAREIGVRKALGAENDAIVWLILGQAGGVIAFGLLTGIGVALAFSRLLQSLLFEVEPIDIPTYAIVSIVLVGAALLASYLPARRASRLDPVEAMRPS